MLGAVAAEAFGDFGRRRDKAVLEGRGVRDDVLGVVAEEIVDAGLEGGLDFEEDGGGPSV